MISLEEIHLLFNGWLAKDSLLMVVGQFLSFGFALRCRVSFVSESAVALITDDGGRIQVDISEPGIEFKYAQPREFPEFATKRALTVEQKLSSSLMILFPPREFEEATEDNAECISFSELVGN